MPSKDTIPHHLTKGTRKELERIRIALAKDLGVDIKNITFKQAEIALRVKSKKGARLLLGEERDIYMGKIK